MELELGSETTETGIQIQKPSLIERLRRRVEQRIAVAKIRREQNDYIAKQERQQYRADVELEKRKIKEKLRKESVRSAAYRELGITSVGKKKIPQKPSPFAGLAPPFVRNEVQPYQAPPKRLKKKQRTAPPSLPPPLPPKRPAFFSAPQYRPAFLSADPSRPASPPKLPSKLPPSRLGMGLTAFTPKNSTHGVRFWYQK